MINAAMGNYRWIARQIQQLNARLPEKLDWVELGSGDGSLSRSLGSRFAATSGSGVTVAGLDLAPRPGNWPENWQWLQGDLFTSLQTNPARWNAAVANLFLHHFEDDQLAHIGSSLSDFDVLLFCEPARRQLHRLQGFLAFPFVNRVTRHDMIVSVEAGFLGDELARTLNLDPDEWQISTSHQFLGGYRFLALRRSVFAQ